MITVYGAAGSGSAPVEATLRLIGEPYEVIESVTYDPDDEAARQRVGALNPLKQVPTLVLPSGETMTESAAILIHLADTHPEARLAPAPDHPARAQFLRWMIYIPGSIYSMFWVRDVPERLAGDDAEQQKLIARRTAARIADCWRMMDEQLTPVGPFMFGGDLSVLDIYVTVVSRWSPRRKRFYEVAPKLTKVVRRVDAEPRLAAFWAERMPFEDGWEG